MPHLAMRDEHREELAEPRGVLIRGDPVLPTMLRLYLEPPIISVGDVVSETLLHAGVMPELMVFDGATRRGPHTSEELGGMGVDTVIENPRSMLSQDAQEYFIDDEPRGTVLVRGEEDLLVIPAVLSAEAGSVVVYGQPGEGVVLIKVDDMLKAFLELYMASFEPVAGPAAD